MRIETTQMIGRIAAEMPSSIPVFEKWGLDYCCGGNRTLRDACSTAGIAPENVVRSLEDVMGFPSDDQNWDEKKLADLIDHLLEKHHVYTRAQLSLIEKLSEKVARVHGQNHPELFKVREVFQVMARELELHMLKEENIAFPYLRALETSVEGANHEDPFFPFEIFKSQPQRVLMADHEMVGEQLREARYLTGGFTPPKDACVTFQAFYQAFVELELDLHRHIHLENNVLFPKAEKLAGALVGEKGKGRY